MELSKYQQNICDFATTGAFVFDGGHLQVIARAGSGKTFTIKHVSKLLPTDWRILRVAFNKHIADVLKVGSPQNVEDQTTNAFGWRICRNNIKGLSYKVDPQKTESIFKTLFNMNNRDERSKYYQQKGATIRLVSLLKANMHLSPAISLEEIQDLADAYGIDIPRAEEFFTKLSVVWEKCLQYTSIMDFDDQIFMPVFLDLPIPKYDVVIVDEAQDLNPIQQELLIRAGQRLIMVGDDRQAIYGFRGADPKSMSNMKERLNATVLPLSICYRCPKKVVQLAAEIVPDIEAAPDAQDGIVEDIKHEKFESQAKDGDYVLCRTTAPLVSTCLHFIREGRKASVRGRDIGQQLLQLVDRISSSAYEPIVVFRDKLNSYRNEQLERLHRAEREAEIIALNDRVDTIMVLVERSASVGDIRNQVDEIFKDERTLADGTVIRIPGVVFCTVHKAKGLEAETIYILERQLMPHPAAKKEWQVAQEMNLKYVAITRSLKNLYWVLPKESK